MSKSGATAPDICLGQDNDTPCGLAEFDTLGEAAEEAHRMQGQIDHGPNSAATFRYIAKPLW